MWQRPRQPLVEQKLEGEQTLAHCPNLLFCEGLDDGLTEVKRWGPEMNNRNTAWLCCGGLSQTEMCGIENTNTGGQSAQVCQTCSNPSTSAGLTIWYSVSSHRQVMSLRQALTYLEFSQHVGTQSSVLAVRATWTFESDATVDDLPGIKDSLTTATL